ncbi:MAG TPA: NAD(+)--rifampin ADP-ribosyltransferase [Rhodanobacter sp.]
MTDTQTYYHGTKANLATGDLIEPGHASNYDPGKPAAFVYLSATLDAAIWGAELAVGAGRGRIYVVAPTGPIEDDPNLTDRKFPGNPTKSYRCRHPLRIVGEVPDWENHPPERLKAMRDRLESLRRQGVEVIEE